MFDLWQRLQNEVKANGKKAGLLAALLLFGCCFWIPMLARAITPKYAVAAATPGSVSSAVLPTPANAPTSADPDRFWQDLAKSLAEDPIYQSAEIPSLSRDPFKSPESPEPAPVEIVEQSKPVEEPQVEEKKPEKLSLSSTIIGRSRRAALINGQLYHLGRQILANGRKYSLTTIESHRVILSSSDETIELKLERRQLKEVLDQGEAERPDTQ